MSRFERMEHEAIEKAFLARAHQRALNVLRDSRIKLVDFENADAFKSHYSREDIRRDFVWTEKKKKEFASVNDPVLGEFRKLAYIFEAIVHEHGELSNWFGPYVETIKPSEYDDIRNGVDEILEFHPEGDAATHLALAIDVTFSDELPRKFERIKREIDTAQLSQVKYFVSPSGGELKSLDHVPRVVVGVERALIAQLVELWLGNDQAALAEHPAQIILLEEINIQLLAFEEYTRRNGRLETAGVFRRAREIVLDIIKQKQPLYRNLQAKGIHWESDRLFQAIKANAEQFLLVPSKRAVRKASLWK